MTFKDMFELIDGADVYTLVDADTYKELAAVDAKRGRIKPQLEAFKAFYSYRVVNCILTNEDKEIEAVFELKEVKQ